MDLLRVEQELSRVRKEMQEEEERYQNRKSELEEELRELERQKSFISLDIDLEQVERAKEILKIGITDFGERPILLAIDDIAKGTPYMKTAYYGLKNYEPWRHQGANHDYGQVSRHGTMVCTVGLKESYRNGLTPEQAEDCLYFLNLLLNEENRNVLVPHGELQNH